MKNCIKVDKDLLNKLKEKYSIKENDDRFQGAYITWRPIRINKLISILGENWFKDKKILELGCGFGHIGIELKKLGSIVTFAEAQEEYVLQIASNAGESDIYIIDQDDKWQLDEEFDLVINWGVNYHLDNWRQDIKNSIKHGKIVSLETEVIDSDDITDEAKIREVGWFAGAKNSVGTRPSVAAIEILLRNLGAKFERYDDEDLNCENSEWGWWYKYDWKEGECKSVLKNQFYDGLRRFWMIYNGDDKG
jgi:hypothetical protein